MAIDLGSDVEQHRHHHTGHRWLDIILAVSAVFMSLVSLFLTIQHGRVLERMVKAETWAFVSAGFSNFNPDFTPNARLVVINQGVGPAQLQSFEVFYKGTPRGSRRELLTAMLASSDPKRRARYYESYIVGRVLAAKEEVDYLDFPVASFSADEYSAISAAMSDLQFRVCYCSVLEECSVLDTQKSQKPVAVNACPVPPVPFRDD